MKSARLVNSLRRSQLLKITQLISSSWPWLTSEAEGRLQINHDAYINRYYIRTNFANVVIYHIGWEACGGWDACGGG